MLQDRRRVTKTVFLFADICDSIVGLQSSKKQEWESKDSVLYLQKTIQKLGYKTILIEPKKNSFEMGKFFGKLSQSSKIERGKNIFFNLVEGFYSRNREAYIPSLAEFFGFPHTGSDAYAQILTLDKNLSKIIAKSIGVPVKPHFVIRDVKEINKIDFLKPMFWKPIGEGSGISISEKNILRSANDSKELRRNILRYEKIMMEEFLPGDEYTLGVIGNSGNYKITRVARVSYPGLVYGHKIKSKSIMPEKLEFGIEKKLEEKIGEYALEFSETIGISGYGRFDFRCDKKGDPFFLEANLTCGLSYKYSTFPVLYRETFGKNYSDMVKEILDYALRDFKRDRFLYGKFGGYPDL